jgi:hypothetical protein
MKNNYQLRTINIFSHISENYRIFLFISHLLRLKYLTYIVVVLVVGEAGPQQLLRLHRLPLTHFRSSCHQHANEVLRTVAFG